MKLNRFTIAIPTYERGDAAVECVRSILSQIGGEDIDVIVLDNASNDDSWQKIKSKLGDAKNVRLVRHSRNLGFVGNFLQSIEYTEKEYTVMLSDEDRINLESLAEIGEYIDKNNGVSFISAGQLIDGKIYRGKNRVVSISGGDFLAASSYVTGTIYHKEKAQKTIEHVGESEFVVVGQCYPHCLLAVALLASGASAIWHPSVLCEKALALKTRVDEGTGAAPFTSLEGRARQIVVFESTFSKMLKKTISSEEHERWEKIREAWMRGMLKHLRAGIAISYAKNLNDFDHSMREFSWPWTIIRKAKGHIFKILSQIKSRMKN